MSKYIFGAFVALVASFTIIVVSSGAASSLLYRSYSVTTLKGRGTTLLQTVDKGCELVSSGRGDNSAVYGVRCPFWVTP